MTGATHTVIAGLTLPRAMPAAESYTFDGTGNRNLAGGGSSSANGTFNRVQNDGTYTYDYDAEGNQIRRTKISDGKVTEYEFDYRNRLVKVTEKNSAGGAATKIVTFQYDAFDRRTGKLLDSDANGTVDRKTAWVWDGQQVIMQLVDADGAGSAPWKLTNRYLYGEAVDLVLSDEQLPNGGIGLTSVSYTTGNVLWPLFDQLGSVRDVVDSNGVIRQHLVFDSFGNRLSETDYNTSGVVIPSSDPAAVDELFGYTGREWDKDVGLQYNRARWYDPAQGRWLSQDPIGFAAGDVNWYRYVGNDAAGATDPTGLEDDSEISRPGEDWRLVYIFAFDGEHPEYVVRKVVSAADAAKNGINPTGPGTNLHPVEHCLNEHLGGKTPYTSASKLRSGASNIAGEPVWIDINKLKRGNVLSYEEIVKMSEDFLRRNPHLRARFELWKKAAEREWLIKGRIPPDAVQTKTSVRLRGVARVGGKALFLYAVYADTRAFFEAEDRAGEAARIAGGWIGSWAGGCAGAAVGAGIAAVGGQAGPQVVVPEEVVTVPISGVIGGIVGSIGGYWAGSAAGRNYYNFIRDYLEKLQ